MATEIERKFLLKDDSWKMESDGGVHYAQGYLNETGNTVRVRVAGDKGFLTVKSKSKGISRLEFEYEIPKEDALQMMELSQTPIVEKFRHKIRRGKHCWEIDEFMGENEGLVIAEIELESEDEPFERPEWLGEEVSGIKRFYNSHLAKKPYKYWWL
ncbi:MAG: CYTH domain-containing protein [Paludibacteraceae bacterium]|jgi:CYTH domain-containing protein|nr:CYTH domain-containing protein [Paludibacteraceae bacterium]MBO5989449.1 CYTH domain-containing protein [Paludibacteraceae bacterium]MEE0997482.1 CYTH domain-containing protein [Paludibacteraceae bacterium]